MSPSGYVDFGLRAMARIYGMPLLNGYALNAQAGPPARGLRQRRTPTAGPIPAVRPPFARSSTMWKATSRCGRANAAYCSASRPTSRRCMRPRGFAAASSSRRRASPTPCPSARPTWLWTPARFRRRWPSSRPAAPAAGIGTVAGSLGGGGVSGGRRRFRRRRRSRLWRRRRRLYGRRRRLAAGPRERASRLNSSNSNRRPCRRRRRPADADAVTNNITITSPSNKQQQQKQKQKQQQQQQQQSSSGNVVPEPAAWASALVGRAVPVLVPSPQEAGGDRAV